jgi:hypothetical protein
MQGPIQIYSRANKIAVNISSVLITYTYNYVYLHLGRRPPPDCEGMSASCLHVVKCLGLLLSSVPPGCSQYFPGYFSSRLKRP